MTTLKKPIFIGFFGLCHFTFFSFFCFYFSNIKKEKTKNAIFFPKTSFLTSPKFCKNTILTHCCTICVSKNAQKHYKNGEKQWKKNLDHFLTLNLDHFLTLKPPNLGPLFNVSRDLVCTLSYHFVFLFCAQLSGNFLKIAFFKKRVQKLGFSIFSVLSIKFENSLFWVC